MSSELVFLPSITAGSIQNEWGTSRDAQTQWYALTFLSLDAIHTHTHTHIYDSEPYFHCGKVVWCAPEVIF